MGQYSGPVNPVSKHAQVKLRDHAMHFPGATEHTPWGEIACKVKGKVFVFLSCHTKGFSMSVKLPQSRADALDNDFAQPTGYGLGKSGWVTCSFQPGLEPPYDLMKKWIEESYRTIAPPKFVQALDTGTPIPTEKPKTARPKRKAAKKPEPRAPKKSAKPRIAARRSR